MNAIPRLLNDFLSLFFPEVCAACGTNLIANESVICSSCIYHLPYTNFHLLTDNNVARQFWGRVPFTSCGSYLFFTKRSKVQGLMHQLKYNNRPEVGFKLGEMYGIQLKSSALFIAPDLIVPVPLHPSRYKKRGYNQSEHFANGLASKLNVPVATHLLKRLISTETQTKKSRFVRYENMQNVFGTVNGEQIAGKHLLLVDDIITTGATIESCANALLKIDSVKLSIAGIAFTD